MLGPQPVEAGADLQQRYAKASTLSETLAILIEQILALAPFERVVVVAGLKGEVEGAAEGVPAEETAAFVDALRSRDPMLAPASIRVPVLQAETPVFLLRSFESPHLITFPTTPPGFVGAVVVDADRHHPAISELGDTVRLATPYLVRCAELEFLRMRTYELESRQVRAMRALDALPDPVLVTDENNRVLLANSRADELLASGANDSRGRRHAVETNNVFFSAFRTRTLLDGERGAVSSRELVLVDPVDGSDLLFEVSSVPFGSPIHGPETLVYILRDITDLKKATLELEVQFNRSVAAEHHARRESERLNVIIENAGVPILVTDRQTNVVLMNREAERLFEPAPVSSPMSSRARDLRANDAKITALISDFLLQSQARREGYLTLADPDLERDFPAWALSTKLFNSRHETTAVVTVLHDLTQEMENKNLAQELRTLNAELENRVEAATRELARRNTQLELQKAQLERASRMKSEFLATMSHELRTPLNAVLGYNSLLRDGLFGDLNQQQEDALRRMRASAEHLLSLISDILDLSTVEAGKVQLRSVDIDMAEFLEALSETVRPMTAQKSLEYRLEVDPGLPTLRADVTRLRQVLLNLLSNAVKFTDAGSVTFRACAVDGRERIRFEVTDTGIGVAPKDEELIFEEFRQVDQSATREYGGTGLGLAISRKLARLMGGSLELEQRPGRGATFIVELPFVPPPEQAAAPAAK